jgi:urea transport system ATP-binding protein
MVNFNRGCGCTMEKCLDNYIEYKHVTAEFSGFKAIDDLNLKIKRGEQRVVIGPNGAGKTTTIDMLTGKTEATKGEICINGQNIVGLSPSTISEKYKIGRKFQGPNVFDYMTLSDNIEVSISGYNTLWKNLFFKRNKEIRDKIKTILEIIGLYKYKDFMPSYLSHGQKQWLEIGMVLAQNPDIITLDEPTAGMTAQETYKTGELINNVMQDKTVIVVEHDIDFIKQIAQYITVLHQGKILAEGTYDEITHNPLVIKAYLKTDDGGI